MTFAGFRLFAVALVALLFVVTNTRAGVGDDVTLSKYFVDPPTKALMDKVADLFEVKERLEKGFEIIVPVNRVSELKALVPDAKLVEADISAEIRRMTDEELAGYHTFATVETHLKDIVARYPDIAKLETYGKSKEGRPLFALKLSDNVNLDEKEPEVMLTSATHGDELISVEVLMGLLDALVEGYRSNPRLTALVDNREIFFLPVVNPDGYTRKSRYSNGVDPNREYPWPQMPDRTPNECIAGVMDFFSKHDIRGSLDYHSSGGMFMYPWSYTTSPVDANDKQRYAATSKKMAATNGYRHGQIPDLLYIAKGSSADYYYWKNKSLAMAVEIGNTNVPPSSAIPAHVKENAEAAWLFLESVE